ncbi:MAG: V-type ATPase 116kDa subunit family protein [Mariprofundaceae bacterium]
MLRLVWVVRRQQIASSLARLVKTGVFHLAEHHMLGETENLDELQRLFESKTRHKRLTALQAMLTDKLPEKTLLNYRLIELPHKELTPPDGAVEAADGILLWAGGVPPEELESHFYDPHSKSEAALPFEMDDCRWQMLFDTQASIGYVGSWAIIDGWIPASEQERIMKLLHSEAFSITDAESCGLALEQVPSLQRRPSFLNGFAAMMRMFGVTGYRELDPTLVLGIGFVFMFGLMFADLGQGLLMFLVGVWLSRGAAERPTLWTHAGQVMIPIGLSAAFFGAMFGSCFAHEDWIPALWFHPMDQILFYLGVCIVIGMTVICMGMAIGLINAWRTWHWKQAIWSDFGLVGLLFYTSMIILVSGLFSGHATLQLYGMIASASILTAFLLHQLFSMGDESVLMRIMLSLINLYDFCLKFLVQTISFVRIAAFTIAHIALSTVLLIAMDASAELPLLSWSIFVLGNFAIIIIEGLLVSIQVVRLNFFEFFTKFVSGQGIAFKPLAYPKEASL